MNQSELTTRRLLLRPLQQVDAPTITQLCQDELIAQFTLLPNPYHLQHAENWIASLPDKAQKNREVHFGICLRESSTQVIGVIGLMMKPDGMGAVLGYWIGSQYRGKGYMSEAAKEIVRFGFEELNVPRIEAAHFPLNEASGKVMVHAGMRCEGFKKACCSCEGVAYDGIVYSITKLEFEQ